MTWLQRYRISKYVKKSFWILPVIGLVLGLMAVRMLHRVESAMGWQLQYDPAVAMTLLATLAASMFTLIVFVCSALLITLQLASAQLSPRAMALFLQNRVTVYSVTLFTFIFTFTLGALIRIKSGVPPLTSYIAVYGSLLSLGVFLHLVDSACRVLRPSGVLALAARVGREVIDSVYPHRYSESRAVAPQPAPVVDGAPQCTVPNLSEGVVLAFDLEGLVSLAQRANCVIELVPQVGDFAAAEQPLFRIFGDGALPSVATLHQSVACGPERTLQQDPAFAFRIMVDIASKGLSPAINDPTTAVLALDQIQYLLRYVGSRHLEQGAARDAQGAVRLLYRMPDWEDYVHLAVTEVRQFGGTSIQIARRLRAMLQDLIQTLPEERAIALRKELDLLERSAKRFFVEAEDQAMADISDLQGVGGKQARKDGRAVVRPADEALRGESSKA